MKPLTTILAFLFYIATSLCHAGPILYCKIKSVNQPDATGSLEKISGIKTGYYEKADGSQFIINRTTGTMLGKYVDNDGWDTSVIEYGSDQMGYKAFSKNRSGYKYAQYIEVQLWSREREKPFVLMSSEVFLGYCTL